jgi:hypothetical protein
MDIKKKEKIKKQPLGKLASKRKRLAKALELVNKKADAFRELLNNNKDKEDDLETVSL